MMDSIRLYRASPDAFFSSLDKKLKEIDDQIENLRAELSGISEVADAFVRNLPLKMSEAPPPTKWAYFAELPNLYFEDVFEPENKGTPLRWVGKSGRLAWSLRMPRYVQYNFEVECVDFASNEMRKSLCLRVGKIKYPWLSDRDGVFKTIILESEREDVIDIELYVDLDNIVADVDVTFSFKRIEISRCG